MDTPNSPQLEAITAKLDTLTATVKRIEQRSEQSQRTLENVEDGISWQVLINDAILCAICLAAAFGVKSIDYIKSDICPELPRYARAAVPLNFCGVSGSNSTAQGTSAVSTEEAQLMAFLDAIAWAEGTDNPTNGYRMIFTGAIAPSLDDHPRQLMGSGLVSDAAGRYQFLSTTWDEYASKLGLQDFSAESQDKAAIAILKENGIPALLASGDVDGAFCAVGSVWASLPCNDYGQPQKPSAELVKRYEKSLSNSTAQGTSAPQWINPAPGMLFTSGFGFREHPLSAFRTCHRGIDLAGPIGTPILASRAGVIQEAGWSDSGFGNYVVIDHDGSKSLYAHLEELTVRVGATVEQGSIIGLMGSTGNSTGPHLHWEVDLGNGTIDPLTLLPARPDGDGGVENIDPDKSQQCEGRKI